MYSYIYVCSCFITCVKVEGMIIIVQKMEELQKGEPHFHLRKEGFVSDRDAENKAEKK